MAGRNRYREDVRKLLGPGRARGLSLGIFALLALSTISATSLGSKAVGSQSSSWAAISNCNPSNPSPSALSIPAKNPTHALAGDRLNSSVEFKVVNYGKKDLGVLVYLPTLVATFPQASAPALKINFAPKALSVAGSGWSNASLRTGSILLSSTPGFDGSRSAYLTSSKIAVMASMPYGKLTLEFRWQWTVYHAVTGKSKIGAWTVPSPNSSGAFLPSEFLPAAWVGVVSSSGSPVPSGSNYTVTLNGSVNSTWFRMVLEYPGNGTEIQSIYENTTAYPLFNATLPMSFRNGTSIPSGHYLIHVHDHCQAIVHILSVAAT